MGAHHFRDKRIKPANQVPSRIIIVPQRSFHQSACIRIIHVVEIASTLLTMTGAEALRLQVYGGWIDHNKSLPRAKSNRSTIKICNRRRLQPVTNYETTPKAFGVKAELRKQNKL